MEREDYDIVRVEVRQLVESMDSVVRRLEETDQRMLASKRLEQVCTLQRTLICVDSLLMPVRRTRCGPSPQHTLQCAMSSSTRSPPLLLVSRPHLVDCSAAALTELFAVTQTNADLATALDDECTEKLKVDTPISVRARNPRHPEQCPC